MKAQKVRDLSKFTQAVRRRTGIGTQSPHWRAWISVQCWQVSGASSEQVPTSQILDLANIQFSGSLPRHFVLAFNTKMGYHIPSCKVFHPTYPDQHGLPFLWTHYSLFNLSPYKHLSPVFPYFFFFKLMLPQHLPKRPRLGEPRAYSGVQVQKKETIEAANILFHLNSCTWPYPLQDNPK